MRFSIELYIYKCGWIISLGKMILVDAFNLLINKIYLDAYTSSSSASHLWERERHNVIKILKLVYTHTHEILHYKKYYL